MRNKTRQLVAGLCITIVISACAGVATADDISNNLDSSVDAVAEVMALDVDGDDGTTELYLIAQNFDGKSGCNLTGRTILELTISSSDTSVASVSPASVTFTSCGEVKELTVTPRSEGSATISAEEKTNTSTGSFNLAPVDFRVTVAPPPNTAPTVVVSGVDPGTEYNKGSVPAATCQVTDTEDGNSSFAATLSSVTGPHASDGIGQQTALCSYTDTGGLTASSSKTYSIVDPSPPGISYVLTPSEPDGANGWYTSNVTLTWTVSDTDTPNSLAKTGCVDQDITADQAAVIYSCSATSAGGSAGPVSISIKRDATPPTVTFFTRTEPNGSGWNNTDVAVYWTCTDDDGSGVVSAAVSGTVTAEGGNQSATGTCQDEAGNTASDTQTGINIDRTAPTIAYVSRTVRNTHGWNNTDVTVNWSCSDSLSGPVSAGIQRTVSSEGAGQWVTGTCADNAGNTTSNTQTEINIDETIPTVGLVGGPADSTTHYFGSVPAEPTCSASDTLSDIDGSCSVSGYSAAVGTHTVKASATDRAGNSSSASATYHVQAWTLKGFYQPVDMNNVFNIVKGGSTVPLKFEVFAGSTELTSTSVAASFVQTRITCDTSATIDEIEVTSTGGTSLRYDAAAGQFIQNWQTPKQSGACYRATMTTQDGSSLVAFFKLK